ncbi:MAG: T9SS type A sorting domain-containing protein [Saprospiraceae bacterium]|nr:T9SS type A sorting domain-containing protein [Saprospiraceae bacterium]
MVLFLSSPAWGQIFYLQPFPDENFPTGWSANNSRVTPNNQAVSSGYNPPPASGGYNMRMQDCLPLGETVQLNVNGVINTVGRTGIRVGFGRRRSNAFDTPVTFAWSNNGTTWTTISSDVTPVAGDVWEAVSFDLPSGAENVSNLRFRFSYVTQENINCTAPPNFRIDDFAVGQNFSLPIELLRFEARAEGDRAHLHWATAVEFNSAYFEVERSGPDNRFVPIGRVAAKGYAREAREYEFLDTKPLPGLNYYRLRLTDADGSFSYSPIRQVYASRPGGELRVFPSPAQDFLRVVRQTAEGDEAVRWRVLDLLGRVWLQGNAANGAAWEIAVHDLPAGSYLLHCNLAGRPVTQLFQKQ